MRFSARITIVLMRCLLIIGLASVRYSFHAGDGLLSDDVPALASAWAAGHDARIHKASLPKANSAHPTSTARCIDTMVDVSATSSDERRLVCSAVYLALRALGRCGIYPRRPFHVQTAHDVLHPFSGVVLGLFNTRLERVLVTQEANIQHLTQGTPFNELRQHDFFQSLIVHEVVHAVMNQNFGQTPTSRSAHEYPAYALQLASLPAKERKKYLDSVDEGGDGEFFFNDYVLSFNPFLFAARAYRHYASSSNSCSRLHATLTGNATFIATVPPL